MSEQRECGGTEGSKHTLGKRASYSFPVSGNVRDFVADTAEDIKQWANLCSARSEIEPVESQIASQDPFRSLDPIGIET